LRDTVFFTSLLANQAYDALEEDLVAYLIHAIAQKAFWQQPRLRSAR
jgi:hypothetical protein